MFQASMAKQVLEGPDVEQADYLALHVSLFADAKEMQQLLIGGAGRGGGLKKKIKLEVPPTIWHDSVPGPRPL